MDGLPSYQGGVTGDNNEENFQKISQRIGGHIQKILQNVNSMQKMVNQLGTPQDSQELRSQLRNIQHYTQQLAKDTSSQLKELMSMPSEDVSHKLTRNRLSDEYMSTLNLFQNTQKMAAQKTKDDVRKSKAQNINIGDPFSLGSTNDQLIEMESPNTRNEQLQIQSERELRALEEQERDIRQLENDIMDVNQIFKELGTMIHDQGTIVDSIESSVEHTSTNVEAATQQLRQASGYQNKLRKKKLYLLIALIVIIVIIIIIIVAHQ